MVTVVQPHSKVALKDSGDRKSSLWIQFRQNTSSSTVMSEKKWSEVRINTDGGQQVIWPSAQTPGRRMLEDRGPRSLRRKRQKDRYRSVGTKCEDICSIR